MGTLGEFSLYALKNDDERFGLKKGDIFIGAPYDMDPEKVSVGFRISDGFDPGCNQYRSDVRKLTAAEIDRVVWKKLRTIAETK